MKNPPQKSNTVAESQIAISVKNISKQFTIPHERINSIKIAFINIFRRKTYESFYALKNVSFEVKKGEFFGILGRNGSGKSTLLKILAGVYTANGGAMNIDGMISPFLELGIGFNPELSGRDNIYLNATVLGLTKREIDEKFDSIVAFSELERFIDQKIKNYSSGMMVRLAFSVSIHANREILLMDEVLAVGDSNFQAKCLREFARYKEMGKTVILVTHDIGTVQRYCDRAMLLRAGEVVMIGSAEAVGNEYIYQNMSDEEKRIRKEQEQARVKEEKDRIQVEKNMAQAQKEAEKLKGKALENEKKRLDDEKLKQIEEQRKQEEENKKQDEERKNRVAEITGIEFLGKDGKVRNVFETGENMSIRVYFKISRNKPVYNFGISIYTTNRAYLCGVNTLFDKVNVSEYLKKGYFQVDLKDIPFSTCSGYITAVIAGENFSSLYAFEDKSPIFNIFSTCKNEGILNLSYSWKK